MDNDEKTIQRVLAGDRSRFPDLVPRYEPPVISMVKSLIDDHLQGEDIAQEVFVTAFRKLGAFDAARSQFSMWLFIIARNKSIDVLRRNWSASDAKRMERVGIRTPVTPSLEWEFFRRLDEAFDGLNVRLRTSFVMIELEEFSYEDAALIEGVSTGTIKSKVYRAKRKLKATLVDLEGA